MNRWIVFDAATAAALESRVNSQVELRSPGGEQSGIVAMALAGSGTAVALVPAADGQHTLLMRFTPTARPLPQTTPPPIVGARVAPGGFLGLADEIVLEEEPGPPKKWWQKLLD